MSHRPIEYAMTHRAGAGGLLEACHRPSEVREAAVRIQKWGFAAESCQSCLARPAVRICAGMPLCGSCRERRYQMLSLPIELSEVAESRQVPDEDDTSGVQLRGLSIVFNAKSVDMGFFEYIRPQSVDRTFDENIDVRALWSHDSAIVLGRKSAGTLRLRKATRGLSVEIDPPRLHQLERRPRRDGQAP